MEPTESEMKFERQPEPVTVTITGHHHDVVFWTSEFVRRFRYKGADVSQISAGVFKIYPRATND